MREANESFCIALAQQPYLRVPLHERNFACRLNCDNSYCPCTLESSVSPETSLWNLLFRIDQVNLNFTALIIGVVLLVLRVSHSIYSSKIRPHKTFVAWQLLGSSFRLPLMFLRRIPSSFHSDKPESTDDVTKEVFENAFTCWKTNDITGQQKNANSATQPHVHRTTKAHREPEKHTGMLMIYAWIKKRLLPDRSRTCVLSCGCAVGRL